METLYKGLIAVPAGIAGFPLAGGAFFRRFYLFWSLSIMQAVWLQPE
ncbi:hypothetical protein QKW52_17345 [Bacillus sonorensis]|nr:hypothetical protein [Bacillus sonorensis]